MSHFLEPQLRAFKHDFLIHRNYFSKAAYLSTCFNNKIFFEKGAHLRNVFKAGCIFFAGDGVVERNIAFHKTPSRPYDERQSKAGKTREVMSDGQRPEKLAMQVFSEEAEQLCCEAVSRMLRSRA